MTMRSVIVRNAGRNVTSGAIADAEIAIVNHGTIARTDAETNATIRTNAKKGTMIRTNARKERTIRKLKSALKKKY